MKHIGTIQLSVWSMYRVEYAYAINTNLGALEKAAETLRQEGYTVEIETMADGVYSLSAQKEQQS